MTPKFSIIIPTYNNEKTLPRAINSVLSQTYRNWELIIVNDCSLDNTSELLKKLHSPMIKIYDLSEHQERLVCRNIGTREVKGEWICFLDADDEYMADYLKVLNDEIERNPDYPIFNFGSLFKEKEIIDNRRYEKGWRIIEPLKLKEIEILETTQTTLGMESFGKGLITTGCFIFKKALLVNEPFYPMTKVAYGSDDSFPALLIKKDEIFKEICKQDEEGNWLPLGNPFGDDYSLFWWLTRYNKSKCLDNILYIHHIR